MIVLAVRSSSGSIPPSKNHDDDVLPTFTLRTYERLPAAAVLTNNNNN